MTKPNPSRGGDKKATGLIKIAGLQERKHLGFTGTNLLCF
jgi:hypothetical protein